MRKGIHYCCWTCGTRPKWPTHVDALHSPAPSTNLRIETGQSILKRTTFAYIFKWPTTSFLPTWLNHQAIPNRKTKKYPFSFMKPHQFIILSYLATGALFIGCPHGSVGAEEPMSPFRLIQGILATIWDLAVLLKWRDGFLQIIFLKWQKGN